MAPRGRGGKFSKPTRGGGKHYSRDLQPLDKDGAQISMWRDPDEDPESSAEEESEESSEEESEGDDGAPSAGQGQQELTREQRKELARKKKLDAIAKKSSKVAAPGDLPTDSEEEEEEEEEDEDLPANPNHTSKARNQARAVTGASGEAASPKREQKENLSRREKEAIAAQQAKERYEKLHAEGKTDEARADLARLKLIREQREAAAARKLAEKEEREERERQNKEKVEKEAAKRAAALGPTGEKKTVKGAKKK